MQTNFDSQWISFEAKDGLNAVGIGALFNVTNLGQMLLLHVCLLPLVVGVIVVWHVLLVRKHGVVPPIDAVDSKVSAGDGDPDGGTVMTRQQRDRRRRSPARSGRARGGATTSSRKASSPSWW